MTIYYSNSISQREIHEFAKDYEGDSISTDEIVELLSTVAGIEPKPLPTSHRK